VAFINFARREIAFKVVYYGPALCGKTTNLEQIHGAVDQTSRGELTMLSTQQDRTLFFEFVHGNPPLPGDPVKKPTLTLLLDGCRLLDEGSSVADTSEMPAAAARADSDPAAAPDIFDNAPR
jgi:hypothetical protein